MSLRWDDRARTLDLGVGDVLAGSERSVRALAMSGRARLAAGVALHGDVQAAREAEAPGFASEVRLRHRRVLREWTVTLHARLDGVLETDEGTLIEEIKSTGLPGEALARAEGFPAWEAQLRVYLWMAAGEGWAAPRGILRVVSLVDGSQRLWTVDDAGAEATGTGVLAWLDEQLRAREAWIAWRALRRGTPVPFAHGEARPGQAEAADTVAQTVAEGGHLLLTAPTGAGKTAAVLHGVLREAAPRDLQVYWATARTTQAAVVEATVAQMQARGLRLRSVTLRAKAAMCLRAGGVDCRPEACRFAAGHHERAPDALVGLPERTGVDDLLAAGRTHRCCPHALGHARAETADLVIGDLNHGFDPDVHTLALDAGWVVVVDEAHQLPERALGWGSPALASALVERARAWVPAGAAWDAFRALAEDVADTLADAALLAVGQVGAGPTGEELLVEPHARRWSALRDRFDELALDHAALVAVTPTEAAGGGVTEGGGSPPPSQTSEESAPDPWTELAWAVSRLAGALERGGEDLAATWTPERLQLVARDAAGVLGPSFARVHASVHASATLAPAWFHRESCGLHPERVREHALPEAFPPERRCVVVVPGVSTAYRARERQRGALVEALQRCVEAVPGNVALWFGSFEQRDDLVGACDWPEREVLLQGRAMDEGARAAMLAAMRGGGPPKVLCGVLGGVFAEGVDLPGEALSACVVVGPALPPPSATLALRQAWWEERFDAGFELASVRPGMVRVVQAAGRVVRGPEDRGAVVLLCSRFLQHDFAGYLPEAWELRKARKPWEVLAAFFAAPAEQGRQLGLFGDG